MNRAIFFDRDGVLIEDSHLITSMKQVTLRPQAASVIAFCKEMGFFTFVVTNQTVVSRGLLSLGETAELNEEILSKLRAQNPFAKIDKTYICPHHPSATVAEFRVSCDCRKPKSGLLKQAKVDYDIDFSQSYLVGDRLTDIHAGKAVGVKGLLLNSEILQQRLIETDEEMNEDFLKPDGILAELNDLKTWIS